MTDRGLFVRERIFVPLWVTTLQNFLSWLWRCMTGTVRLVWRYPIPAAGLVAEGTAYRWNGWPAIILATLAVVMLLLGWAWRWPASYTRRVVVPVRSWWRFQRIYARRWRDLMAGCGLLESHDRTELMPQIARLRSYRTRDELVLTLAPGQIPDDVSASAEAMAHGLGAWRVTTTPARPGRIAVLVLWTDPLADPIHPSDMPDPFDPAAVNWP